MSTKEIREALEQMRINFLIEINRVIDGIGFENQNKVKLPISKIISTDSEEFKKKYTEFLQVGAKNALTEKESKESTAFTENQKEITEMPYLKDGKLRKRKDGVWEIRYRKNGYDKSFYSVIQGIAVSKFREFLKTIKPDKKEKAHITLNNWAEKWLNEVKKPVVKAGTYRGIEIIINKHIVPVLGGYDLKRLTAMQIQEFYNDIESTRVLKSVKDYLNALLNNAVDNGLIKHNPAKAAVAKNHIYENGKALTLDEQKAFENALMGSPLEDYYLFCLFTGVRRHEALLLRHCDILDNQIMITSTKKKGAAFTYRYIPIFDSIKQIADKYRSNSTDFVFNYTNDYVSRHFSDFIKGHHLHDLRHTFNTRMFENGVSDAMRQKWLGQSSAKVNKIYTHVLPEQEQKELNKANLLPQNTTPKNKE